MYIDSKGDFLYIVERLKIPKLPPKIVNKGKDVLKNHIEDTLEIVEIVVLEDNTCLIKAKFPKVQGVLRKILINEIKGKLMTAFLIAEEFWFKKRLEIERKGEEI